MHTSNWRRAAVIVATACAFALAGCITVHEHHHDGGHHGQSYHGEPFHGESAR